jgi:hypothetical protein
MVLDISAPLSVECRVREIGKEVEQNGHEGDDDEVAHHRVQVTGTQRALEERTHTGDREDELRDDGPTEQPAEVGRDERRDRDQHVAECVADDHHPLGHALGASGAHVVLAEHLDHAGAGITRVPRERDRQQRDRRKQQVEEDVQTDAPHVVGSVSRRRGAHGRDRASVHVLHVAGEGLHEAVDEDDDADHGDQNTDAHVLGAVVSADEEAGREADRQRHDEEDADGGERGHVEQTLQREVADDSGDGDDAGRHNARRWWMPAISTVTPRAAPALSTMTPTGPNPGVRNRR